VKLLKLLLPLALVLLAGCKKNIQTNEAIRDAVLKHLSANSGLHVAAMDVDVAAVTFRDNDADATITFKPKGAPASQGMSMRYSFERQGDAWVVKKKSDSGAHAGGAMPGATPEGAGGAMPAGHPPVAPDKTPESK